VLTSLFFLMAAIAVLPVLWRLLRERPGDAAAGDDPAAVYAAQLADVARDRARGALDDATAAALEAEIGRRLLAVAREPQAAARRLALPERAVVALAILVFLPAGAFAWYEGISGERRDFAQSDPGGAPTPAAARAQRDAPHDLADSAARLAERLETEPDNLDGWLLLARTYTQLGRSEQAARVHRRIAAIPGVPAARLAAIAEDLIAGSAGTVSPEAVELLTQANRRDPADPRARFFLGLARAQSGAPEEGLDIWLALERDSPAGAPWLDGLRSNIARLAEEAGVAGAALAQRRARVALATTGRAPVPMPGPAPQAAATQQSQPQPQHPSAAAGAPPRGPTAQDVAAASRLNADERAGMIRGMVEGLAARLESEPGDIDGWLRLGRAWRVLGEPERGLEALRRAADQAPTRQDALGAYSAAIAAAPPALAARHPAAPVHERLLALAPARPEALQALGDGALEADDKPLARRYWEKQRSLLPADSPARRGVDERIERLGPR
jgi:cytochrome c-type biogenesis protein CcmH